MFYGYKIGLIFIINVNYFDCWSFQMINCHSDYDKIQIISILNHIDNRRPITLSRDQKYLELATFKNYNKGF